MEVKKPGRGGRGKPGEGVKHEFIHVVCRPWDFRRRKTERRRESRKAGRKKRGHPQKRAKRQVGRGRAEATPWDKLAPERRPRLPGLEGEAEVTHRSQRSLESLQANPLLLPLRSPRPREGTGLAQGHVASQDST